MALAGQQQKPKDLHEKSSKLLKVLTQLPNLLTLVEQQIASLKSDTNDLSVRTTEYNMAAAEPYISCMKCNGVRLLPPVLDEKIKEEMRMYKEEAIRRERDRNKSNFISVKDLPVSCQSVCQYADCIPDIPPRTMVQTNLTVSPTLNTSQCELKEIKDQLSITPKEYFNSKKDVASKIPVISSLKYRTSTTDVAAIDMDLEHLPLSKSSKDADSLSMLNFLSDFGSLEDGSLPTELNGIPLTSKCEQQITRDLSTLTKHLPDTCSSDNSDFYDFSSDFNFGFNHDVPCLDSQKNKNFANSDSITTQRAVSSNSPLESNVNVGDAEDTSCRQDNSDNSVRVLKAPVFLTNENGLQLSVKNTSPVCSSSSSPSMKANPAVKDQPWIMDSPLIAYVTKSRSKPVGICLNLLQSSKVQHIHNATFTISDEDEDDDVRSKLHRPVISSSDCSVNQNANTSANLSFSNNDDLANNSASQNCKKSQMASAPNEPCKLNSNTKVASEADPASKQDHTNYVSKAVSTNENLNSSFKVMAKRDNLKYSKIFYLPALEQHITDLIDLNTPSLTSSPSSSPHNLSIKEHLGDESMDELLLGAENIGLVPRIAGDGSDVPSPSTVMDLSNILQMDLVDKRCSVQSWPKNHAFSSPELVRANFSPVGTDSPHNLQVSAASMMADVTNSSGVASLGDFSTTDSSIVIMARQEAKFKTSPNTEIDLIPKCLADSGIRRGSYTLLEPSINLTKYTHSSPHQSPGKYNGSVSSLDCNISEKIPSYEDFETDLHKRIPARKDNITPPASRSILGCIATPSKPPNKMKYVNTEPKYNLRKKSQGVTPLIKSTNTNSEKFKDSICTTPQFSWGKHTPSTPCKIDNTKINGSKPDLNICTRDSRTGSKRRRSSNGSTSSLYQKRKDVENLLIKDEVSNVSNLGSPVPTQSPSAISSDRALDWDAKIEEQLKQFFAEKKQSYFKRKEDYDQCQEKMETVEEKIKKTLESMSKSKYCPKGLTYGLDSTPELSFSSTDSEYRETPPGLLSVPTCPIETPAGLLSVPTCPIETPAGLLFVPTCPIETPAGLLFVPTCRMDGSSTVSSRNSGENINFTDMNPTRRFVLISAVVKGYLTRRLFLSPKVEYLRKTIKECINLQDDLANTNTDLMLGINNQLASARQDLYSIFFEITVQERMNIINQSRTLLKKKPTRNPPQPYLKRKNKEKAIILVKTAKQNLQKKTNHKVESLSTQPIRSPNVKKTLKIKQEKRTIRKVAAQQVQKSIKVVSVGGKMAATRFVSTKTKDAAASPAPPKNTTYKPWR